MTKPAPEAPRMMEPLSDEEFEVLNDFLLSEDLSDQTMVLESLDGYLTALVIGPVNVPVSEWLPRVWGPDESHTPHFERPADAQWMADLILRHMNGLVSNFVEDTDDFEPLIGIVTEEEGGPEYIDGELWASGFLQGVALRPQAWQPLLDDPQGQAWLRPLQLLGTENLGAQDEALVATPKQREALSKQIAASAVAIYRYWQPTREVMPQQLVTETVRRDQPKVGRNDPCPCGSGKKYKKCCGAAES